MNKFHIRQWKGKGGPMVATIIECAVKEIKVGIGMGNTLILFKGDTIRVSVGPNPKRRYRVINSRGEVIGTLSRESIERITQKSITVTQEDPYALAPKK